MCYTQDDLNKQKERGFQSGALLGSLFCAVVAYIIWPV